jgi:ribonuclease HI
MKNVTLTTSSAINYECPEGGWAYVLRCGSHSVEGSGRTKEAFRLRRPRDFLERLELLAVIKGFERLKVPCEVLLMSASEELVRCVSSSRFVWREQGWPKSHYLADLGQRLDEAAEKHIIDTQRIGRQIGDPDMKRCDDLAWSQASWFPEWFTG